MRRSNGWGGFFLARKWVTLAALLLIIIIPSSNAQQQPTPLSGTDQTLVPTKPGPPPKAIYKEMRYAFGEVQRGQNISHTFIVKNEGEGPLAISNVSPG